MTGNLLTLAEARSALSRFVGAGGSCNTTVIDAYIAEAEERLWNQIECRLSLARCRIRVQNRCFPLPLEVEKILDVSIDGKPAHIFNNAYEMLSSGPGDLEINGEGTGYRDLEDMGEFPTQFDVPNILVSADTDTSICDAVPGSGFKLAAFSIYSEDADGYITLQGLDTRNDAIMTTIDDVWTPGEKIHINRWYHGTEGEIYGKWVDLHLTTNNFRQLTRVMKSVTKGPVSLYAIDTTTNEMYLLSKMIPEATVPSYRRYRITNQACTDDCASILARVKLRYVKPTTATSVLAVQNIYALKNMIMALVAEESKDLAGALAFEQNAVRLLLNQKRERDECHGMPVIVDVDTDIAWRRPGYFF